MSEVCCACGEPYEHTCCNEPATCWYKYCDACWEKLMCEAFECKPEELLMNQ